MSVGFDFFESKLLTAIDKPGKFSDFEYQVLTVVMNRLKECKDGNGNLDEKKLIEVFIQSSRINMKDTIYTYCRANIKKSA